MWILLSAASGPRGWEIQAKAGPGEWKEKQIYINMAGECLGQEDTAVLEEKT